MKSSPNMGLNIPEGSDVFDYKKFLEENLNKIDDHFMQIPVAQEIIATEGQTVFNLSSSYVVGTSAVSVEVDGVPQDLGEGFTESSTSSITLTEGVPAGASVTVTIRKTPAGVNTQIADLSAQLADKAKKGTIGVFVEDYPRLGGETDDTARIQRAIEYAKTLKTGSNAVGNSLYYETKVSVIFDAKTYTTSSVLTYYKGVGFESKGQTTLIATSTDKTIKCMTGTNNRFEVRNITFVGYSTAIEINVDVDVSTLLLQGVNFHMCGIGLDTVSFAGSRSKMARLELCTSWKTDVFVKNYCDKMVLDNCWCTHSGWAGAAIYNDGNLVIDAGIFVPTVIGNNDSRWIDNYESNGQQGVFIRGVRFGGESGGHPIIFNYASYDNNMAVNQGNVISISDCQLASAGGTRDSNIVLFAMPNRISIKNSFGFFDMTNGIISCDSTFNPDTIAVTDIDVISIDLDHSIYQSKSYPRYDSRLQRFMAFSKPQPPANVQQPYTKLTPKSIPSIASGSSQIIYKLGLNTTYPNGILSLNITATKLGSVEVTRKRVDMYIKNNTVMNNVAGAGNIVKTNLYDYYTTTAVDFNLTIAVNGTTGLLEVSITPNTGTSSMGFYIEGEVILPYLSSNGRSVFEN